MNTFVQIPICKELTDKSIIIPQATAVCITAITDVRVWKQKQGKAKQGDGLLIPEGTSRIFAIDGSEWEKSLLFIQGTANIGFDNGQSGYDMSLFSWRIFDATFDNTYN